MLYDDPAIPSRAELHREAVSDAAYGAAASLAAKAAAICAEALAKLRALPDGDYALAFGFRVDVEAALADMTAADPSGAEWLAERAAEEAV